MSRFNNPQTQPARGAAQARSGAGSASLGSPDDCGPSCRQTGANTSTSAGFRQPPAPPSYAQPQPAGYPPQSSPYAQQGYSQLGGYGADTASHDPFAALRADPPTQPPRQDYQYPQQADAFTNGQYALPQQPALSTYQPRAPAPAVRSYAQSAQTYAAQPAPQPGFRAASAYATPQPDTTYSGFDNWSATQPHAETRDYPAAFDAAYQQLESPRTQPPAGAVALSRVRTITLSSAWSLRSRCSRLWTAGSASGRRLVRSNLRRRRGRVRSRAAAARLDQDRCNPCQHRSARRRPPYAYTALMGGSPSGTPPVVKSAEGPPRSNRPIRAENSLRTPTARSWAGSKAAPPTHETGSTSSSSDTDASGARKVPVLVVSRDGTIQPPAAPSDDPAGRTACTCDGRRARSDCYRWLRRTAAAPGQPTKTVTASKSPSRPLVVSPPSAPVKPKMIAAATPTSMTDSGPAGQRPRTCSACKKAPVKKTAAVAPPSSNRADPFEAPVMLPCLPPFQPRAAAASMR